MLNEKNQQNLQEKLGYFFKKPELLTEALTHSSYAHELISRGIPSVSNERLEFLGDSVLEIVATTFLFESNPDVPEGELTAIRSEIICTDALSSYARALNLGTCLYLGNGEKKSGGRDKPTTLENAFEALLGAVYLDSDHDLKAVTEIALPFLSERAKRAEFDPTDYKSALQQIIQETPGETLSYEVTAKEGPDHSPTFTVVAMLNSNIIGTGKAHKKSKAEQAAAKDALTQFFKKSR